jgi:predicted dinucleotide-binding enzyme
VRICVIGAGNIGGALARNLATTGHSVCIANSRGAETLKSVAEQTEATAVSLREGTHDADVAILSVPFASVPLLGWLLSGLPPEVLVADTSNYFPNRDGPIVAVDRGQVESLWVSEQIGRPVIKAWNSALAATLSGKGRPRGMEGRIALSVAGDDLADKEVVTSLVEDTRFDAVDGGSLGESWRQQPGTRAYCTELTDDELRNALATADRSRQAAGRDPIAKVRSLRGDELTTADIVRLNRALGA